MITPNTDYDGEESLTLSKTAPGWIGLYRGDPDHEDTLERLYGDTNLELDYHRDLNFLEVADLLNEEHPNLQVMDNVL